MSIRISIYHWLPLADNMLPDIEKTLQTNYTKILKDKKSTSDAIQYDFFAPLDNFGSPVVYGKINQRGFLQHSIEIAPLPKVGINITIDEAVEKFQSFLINFIFDIVPLSVKNKLAVLNEGIVSFQSFESEDFLPNIDIPAKAFIKDYQLTAILMDCEFKKNFNTGFYLEKLGIGVEPTNSPVQVYINGDENCLLFYSEQFLVEEIKIYDNVIYKYCALIIFARVESRIISILKLARDNVIPLRRVLVQRLQKNTEEHFGWLTRLKKYLTYTNVKLPVIEKVLNHLSDAYESSQFIDKLKILNADTNEKYPTIECASSTFALDDQSHLLTLTPSKVIAKIHEDIKRLKALFLENTNEIKVFSQELSGVLQGNLMAENVQILSRELDATRLQVELDRGGKNRSNALKMLTYVTSASLGITIGSLISAPHGISLLIGAGFSIGSFFISELLISQKSHYFRMVIPFNMTVSRIHLEKLLHTKIAKVIEHNGTRRISTWAEKFNINRSVKEKFDVTVDYETRGYIHTITLENEANKINFNPLQLIIPLVAQMVDHGCIMLSKDKSESHSEETSLLAEILLHMDLYLEDNLRSLNKILAYPVHQLIHDYEIYSNEDDQKTLSEEQREYIKDIIENKNKYKEWILRINNNKGDRLYKLLGEDNLAKKQQFLELTSSIDDRKQNKSSDFFLAT